MTDVSLCTRAAVSCPTTADELLRLLILAVLAKAIGR